MKRSAATLILFSTLPLHAEEYAFDIGAYQKESPLELNGYAELRYESLGLDRDAALYRLNYEGTGLEELDRLTEALEVEANYRQGDSRLTALFHASAAQDRIENREAARFHQAYLAHSFTPNLTLEGGKRTLKWGKGYAWNPVAFLERPKDPLDPELSREGFVVAQLDAILSGAGSLRTLAFTPVLLPVDEDVNDDFGPEQKSHFAAKLYMLYRDIDIDLLYRSRGSRSEAYGFDFAANLRSNLELHGEWALFKDETRRTAAGPRIEDLQSCLIGLRYLTATETTYIAEYYYDGRGLNEGEFEDLIDRIESGPPPSGDNPVAASNPGQRYGYFRVSQKDAFGWLYFNTGLTAIVNLDDRSFSLTPEVLYTGVTNLEMRIRLVALSGQERTEFGEKAHDYRAELRLRYFF